MVTKLVEMLAVLTLVAVLILLQAGGMPVVGQEPEPPRTPEPPIPFKEPGPYTRGLQRGPDGVWSMPEEMPQPERSGVQPTATGGPDDFGYTWNDSVPFNWIDATTGTDTGLGSPTYVAGPFPIGFSFRYYENTYTQLWVSRYGLLGFNPDLRYDWGNIPVPVRPNNIIAPYWTYLQMDAASKVYYLSGGTSPNRYFVVQWHQVHDGYTDNTFTFQAVLLENGDILLQHHTMNYGPSSYYCASAGIEDSLGADGLRYQDCGRIASNKATRFFRPAPAARVRVWPSHQGRFTRAGAMETFYVPIHNTGELGNDTYELTVSSPWWVGLYAADGITRLTDTDGDGTVDSGLIAQGGSVAITVKVQTPSTASVGDANTATVSARSSVNTTKQKTATFQTAIPAPFAQVFRDNADGAMNLYLVQPQAQALKKATPDGHYGYYMAVAETPGGNFVYAWSKGRCLDDACNLYGYEIEYTLLNPYGDPVRAVVKLTDHSGATMSTYDSSPAVAVVPNGRVGVLWYRYLWNSSTYQFNYNIYFAVLDASGNVVVPPTNLTNNTVWGDWDDLNVPRFYNPHIAATGDNRFILAWQREHQESAGRVDDIYYAVRNAAGAGIKPITRFTFDTPGWDEAYWYPNLAQLGNNWVLLVWQRRSDSNVYYAVLNSTGDTVKAATSLFPGYYGPDAVQLPNGNIVVAWTGKPPNPGEVPWTARYYNNETLTEPAALVRTDETIDFRWDLGSPSPGVNPDYFSARWTGTINVEPGVYEFTMGSDDGSRLWIDNQLIMDHWDECCAYWGTTVTLTGGAHQVRMEMHEHEGAAWASLAWQKVNKSTAIHYTVLDSAYNRVAGLTVLDNPAAITGDAYVSVAADNAGRAILTWMEDDWSYRPNLYYALVDGNGSVLTPPMIFRSSQATAPYIETSFSGYGNTSYSSVVVPTPTPTATATATPIPTPLLRYGMNLAPYGDTVDPASIERVAVLRFEYVQHYVSWGLIEASPAVYHWGGLDTLVRLAEERGIKPVFRIYQAPAWARSSPHINAPPSNNFYLARFVSALVSRYGTRVAGYVIWNEPNLPDSWGNQPVNAAAYVDLLRAAYSAAKAVNPSVLIISAGLAPTQGGGGAVNDITFLQQMYAAGLKNVTDAVGMNGLGFAYSPDDTSDPNGYNFSRLARLRQVMLDNGDASKRAWALEVGWVVDTGRDLGPFNWWKVSEEQQAQYLRRALDKAASEWPWLEALFVWNLDFGYDPGAADKEAFAIVDRLAYQCVSRIGPPSICFPTPTATPTPSPTSTPTPTPTPTPCPDAFEPDDQWFRAKVLPVGSAPHRHTFHVPGDVDFVKFVGRAGYGYVIRTLDLTSGVDTVLCLYSTDGQTPLMPCNDDDPSNPPASRLAWDCPADGTYFAKVTNLDPQAGGCSMSYSIEVIEAAEPPNPRKTYLPLILRNHPVASVPSLCDGGFEAGVPGPCWSEGGELARSAVERLDVGEPTPKTELAYAGRYSALLGDPSLGTGVPPRPAIPVGSAWIEQTIRVPNTSTPHMSFWYRIITYDVAQDALRQFWDIFAVEVNGELAFWDGNREPGTSQRRHDLGWRLGEVDLSRWRGQMVTVRFANWNGYTPGPGAGLYNTWTYVDEVEVEP